MRTREIGWLICLIFSAGCGATDGLSRSASYKHEEPPIMAETIWQGTTGNWSTAGNWSGGVPGANATAVFDGTSQVSVTAGLNQSAAGTLYRIRIHPQYTGSIGASGDPLIIHTYNLEHLGRGAVYWQNHLDASPYVLVDTRPGYTALTVTGDEVTFLDVRRGDVSYGTSAGATPPVMHLLNHASVTCTTGRVISELNMAGGAFTGIAQFTNAHIAGGTVTLSAGSVFTALAQFGGDITLSGSSTGITRGIIFGGSLDVTRAASNVIACITIFPGADVRSTSEQRANATTWRDLTEEFPKGYPGT